MLCSKCKKEISPKVYPHHVKRCKNPKYGTVAAPAPAPAPVPAAVDPAAAPAPAVPAAPVAVKAEKPISQMKLGELKKKAGSMGIPFPKNATKATLKALIAGK